MVQRVRGGNLYFVPGGGPGSAEGGVWRVGDAGRRAPERRVMTLMERDGWGPAVVAEWKFGAGTWKIEAIAGAQD
jgi:hypothetical protein